VSSWTIASRAIPSPGRLLASVLWGMAATASAVGLLATSAWLITRASEAPPILYLTFAVVGVRAFALGRAAFRYVERVSSHSAAFHALETLRVWMFDRIQPLTPAGVRGIKRGGLLRALVADVDTLQDLPLRVISPLAGSLTVVMISLGAIASVTSVGALTLAGTIGLAVLAGIVLTRIVGRASDRDISPGRATYADDILDALWRRRVLQAFGAATQADAKARQSAHNVLSSEIRHAVSLGLTPGLLMMFTGLAIAAMALIAQPVLAAQDVSAPLFAVLVLIPLALFESLAAVPAALNAWRLVQAGAKRIADTLPDDLPREIPRQDEGLARVSLGEPSLRLEGVQASWPGATSPAIAPLNLNLGPGDRVALSGPSGSGKSTLAYLLVRFLDYTGDFTVCGVQAREIPQDQVREVIVLCEQRPHLFSTSIRHNLSFAKPDASDGEFLSVLDRVGLSSWVASRGGLDASVGERGTLVSGGQAQRIALARALLSDAPIIVFDEPTANVERTLSDQLMWDLLQAGSDKAGRIVIVMSHTDIPRELITQKIVLTPVEPELSMHSANLPVDRGAD